MPTPCSHLLWVPGITVPSNPLSVYGGESSTGARLGLSLPVALPPRLCEVLGHMATRPSLSEPSVPRSTLALVSSHWGPGLLGKPTSPTPGPSVSPWDLTSPRGHAPPRRWPEPCGGSDSQQVFGFSLAGGPELDAGTRKHSFMQDTRPQQAHKCVFPTSEEPNARRAGVLVGILQRELIRRRDGGWLEAQGGWRPERLSVGLKAAELGGAAVWPAFLLFVPARTPDNEGGCPLSPHAPRQPPLAMSSNVQAHLGSPVIPVEPRAPCFPGSESRVDPGPEEAQGVNTLPTSKCPWI